MVDVILTAILAIGEKAVEAAEDEENELLVSVEEEDGDDEVVVVDVALAVDEKVGIIVGEDDEDAVVL